MGAATPPPGRHTEEELARDFDKMMDDPWWEKVVALAPAADQPILSKLAFKLVCFYAGAFHRRIVYPLQQYPYRIFLLIKSRKTCQCQLRRKIASEMLDMDEACAHINIRKMRAHFRPELRYVVKHGVCPTRLWTFVKMVASSLEASSQSSEAMNSMIGREGERSPGISLELLSGRLQLKHAMGVSALSKGKWSLMQPAVREVFDTCLDHMSEASHVTGQDVRWAPPLPVPTLTGHVPEPGTIARMWLHLNPALVPSAAVLWAAAYHQAWTAIKDDGDLGVVFGSLEPWEPGKRMHICVDKHRSVAWMMEVTTACEVGAFEIRTPMRFMSSVDLFASKHSEVTESHATLEVCLYKLAFLPCPATCGLAQALRLQDADARPLPLCTLTAEGARRGAAAEPAAEPAPAIPDAGVFATAAELLAEDDPADTAFSLEGDLAAIIEADRQEPRRVHS